MRGERSTHVRAWMLCLAFVVTTRGHAASAIAIIIDDIGYSLPRGERALALPGPLTMAVLPFTPAGRALAELAPAQGKDVILHQPMESARGVASAPGTLTTEMDADELRATFARALADVPSAVGVSNHAGSRLTERSQPMDTLMREIHARGLFFVDSRTTTGTVALDTARALGVPAVKRDVFLDNELAPAAIEAAFARALTIARRQGHVVIIAHPHDASLAFLERVLPEFPQPDAALVSVRELLEITARQASTARVEPRLGGFELEGTFVDRAPDDGAQDLAPAAAGGLRQSLDVGEARDTP